MSKVLVLRTLTIPDQTLNFNSTAELTKEVDSRTVERKEEISSSGGVESSFEQNANLQAN